MLKKTAILVSVLVGLVLGGSLIFGLTRWGGGEGGPTTSASEAPGVFDPERAGRDIEVRRIGSGSGYWVQQTDPQTHRIIREFRYEKLDPEADGRFHVADPEARLYVDARRVVRMRAESGFLIAPDRMPQQGRFSDGVTIELFAAEPGERPRIGADSPDLMFTISLEEARFNTLLGKIDSDGPVALESAEAQFSGRGLTLVYDELRRRIDYMRIEEGDYLVYRPDGPAAAAGEGSAEGPGGAVIASAETTEGEASSGRRAGDVQYYRARFERSVVVRAGERRINADVLEATFGLARARRDEVAGVEPGDVAGEASDRAAGRPAPVSADADAAALTLRWSGPLTLEPLEGGAEVLAGPEDAVLVFEGSPIDLRDGRGGRLVGERAVYQRSTTAVSAVGSAAYPLRVSSPTLGELDCISVDLNLRTGEGKLWGEGAIRGTAIGEGRTAASESTAAPGEGDRDTASGLPPGFAVRWSERVDLKLAGAGRTPGGLESARFVGEVEVEDRRFSMSGHALAVAFEARGDAAGGGRRLASIEAESKSVGSESARRPVVFASRQGRASGERFVVAMDEHEGRAMPRRLQAWGGVKLADARRSIAAERLDVRFRPGGEGTGEANADGAAMALGGGTAAFEVATVQAEGAVELTEAGSRVQAGRLLAHADRDVVDLWGEPRVIVEREGARLTVPRLSVREGGAKAVATGAGRFEYVRPAEADEPEAAEEGGEAGSTDKARHRERLVVRWTRKMSFDDAADLLKVEGKVVADHEDRADHANRLEAERVALSLVPREAGESAEEGAADSPLSGRPLLEKLVAEENAVAMATRWASADRERVLGRLRIAGPLLTFDNATQRAVVEGAGSMLIEDYSEPDGRRGLGDTRLSGRGKTLFTWLGRLVLDGADSDVVIERGANMTHKPAGEDRVVDLQAHRLVADMSGLGGVEALQLSRFDDLKIDELIADRDVELRDGGRIVTAGHARYLGAERVLRLDAEAGGMVEVVKLDEPRPLRARRIRWDLAENRVEVVRGEY